jgi:hypothetical protein
VRYNDNRDALFAVQPLKQGHNFGTGRGVHEVSNDGE